MLILPYLILLIGSLLIAKIIHRYDIRETLIYVGIMMLGGSAMITVLILV
jgi:hypothetical protein